jgi:hypothetical protein
MEHVAKEVLKTAATSAAGGCAGAATYGIIGGVGLTAVGTGVGITLAPFVAIGAGLGAAGYGVYWLGKQMGKRKKTAQAEDGPKSGTT